MTEGGEGELQALRRRAYARGSDIDADPVALARLRELEAASSPLRTTAPAPAPVPTVIDEVLTDGASDSGSGGDPAARRPSVVLIGLRRLGDRLIRLRRSTVLLAIAAMLVVAALAVILAVVQRVQTDPLQTGAEQIARLQPDPGFVVPRVFLPDPTGERDAVTGFEEFNRLRAVVTDTPYAWGAGGGGCLLVFDGADAVDPESSSFNGAVFYGCAAGEFPAIVQFDIEGDGLPNELRESLEGVEALQFVYDDATDEVVVFSG